LGFLLEQKAIDYDEGIDLVDEARILFRQARTKSASINPKYKEILIVYNEGGRTLPSFWRIQPWHGTPSLGSHCHANLAGAMSQMSFGPRPNPFCPSMFARPREVDHPHPIGRSSMESCMSWGQDASGKCSHASTAPVLQPMSISRNGLEEGFFPNSGNSVCWNMTAVRALTGRGSRWTA